MLKSMLIEKLAEKFTDQGLDSIDEQVNFLIDILGDALAKGNRVEIREFGSFNLRYHPPRRAHNPRTGERLTAPEKYTPHFKSGKKFREILNTAGLTDTDN